MRRFKRSGRLGTPPARLLAAALAGMRIRAGLNQHQLEVKMAAPCGAVGKAEQAAREMTFLEVVEWCSACGVPFLEFASRFEEARQKLSP